MTCLWGLGVLDIRRTFPNACRLEHNCRQQEAAREQLQRGIHSQLDVRGWGLWPSTSLSSRIRRELHNNLSRGQA